MPQTLYEVVWIFIVYAFIGWCTEVSYAALDQGIFVNRGFLNGPYCPIYGVGVLIVVVLLTPLKGNLFILCIGSFLLTSLLEFITGYIMEKIFHNKWWDYSDKPFNIKGYVCLKFSILWGLACTFIMTVIHPMIYKMIQVIPHIVGVIFLSIIMIGFIVDEVVTITTITKFNKQLRIMNEIAARIKVLSNEIGENIYENVSEALEKKEVISESMDTIKEQITEKKEKITGSAAQTKEKLLSEQRELQVKYKEMFEKSNAITSRLMQAFPEMKSGDYNELLQKLKIQNLEKWKNRRKYKK